MSPRDGVQDGLAAEDAVVVLGASDGCGHDAATRTLTCLLGDLAEGATVQVLSRGLVREDVTGVLPATATVVSTTGDAATASATATTSATTMAMADLGLTVAAAVEDRTITYTAVVTNAGPSTVADAVVMFVPPAGTTVVMLPDGCTRDGDGDVVRCTLGRLAPGASTELVLVLAADATTSGDLSLLAEVASAAAEDPDTADNSVEVVVAMDALPDTGADADRIALVALLLLLAGVELLRRERRTRRV